MAAESDNSGPQTAARKTYRKPTLARVAVLSAVTAKPSTSSSSDSTNVCWVARAAFGEADIRWMIFRAWLVDDAAAWFRRLYIRHGEAIGNWLADQDRACSVVRALMMPSINRKLRG